MQKLRSESAQWDYGENCVIVLRIFCKFLECYTFETVYHFYDVEKIALSNTPTEKIKSCIKREKKKTIEHKTQSKQM